jgi:pimeloyl-ACP methyl ester carboxylesterase
MSANYTVKTLESFDGTRICYRIGGQPSDSTLVICNGYGGSFRAWRDVLARLPHHRCMSWDYRGLYQSGCPTDRSRLTVGDHVRDLQAICEREGIDNITLVGWSVGCQVALERLRLDDGAVSALALIHGAHERVLSRSFDSSAMRLAIRSLLVATRSFKQPAQLALLPALRLISRPKQSLRVLDTLGMVSGQPATIHGVMHDVLELDYEIYARLILLADAHRTDAFLPHVQVPTLVTAGDRDLISPPQLGRHIAARIPNARFRLLRGTTHYAVMEQPQLLAALIDELVARV